MIQYLHEDSDAVCCISAPLAGERVTLFALGEHSLAPSADVGERLNVSTRNTYSPEAARLLTDSRVSACEVGGTVCGYVLDGNVLDRLGVGAGRFFMPVDGDARWPATTRSPVCVCTSFEHDQLTEFDSDYTFVCLLLGYVVANRGAQPRPVRCAAAERVAGVDDFVDADECRCEFCASYARTLERLEYSPVVENGRHYVPYPEALRRQFVECLSNARLTAPDVGYPLDVHHSTGLRLKDTV